ncbi:hypothetical protein JHK86_010007 [Glycine max]|nr:hypothetical protein JHK86_010007 [Glycine max]
MDDTASVSSLEKTSALALGSQYKSNGIVTQSSSTENNDKKVMSIGSIDMTTRGKATLKNFQKLENKLKDLQKDLKELNDYQNKERNYLWRQCA